MNNAIAFTYIAAAVLFILGIKLLSSPKTGRLGNLLAAAGMLAALIATVPLLGRYDISPFSQERTLKYVLIVVGILIGLVVGAVGAYSVKMTAMPQMVALFNGVGGGAGHWWQRWNLCTTRPRPKASPISSPSPCCPPS